MQSVLKRLYEGNIEFDAMHYGKNTPYARAARKRFDLLERLEQRFDEETQALFEQYHEAQGDVQDIMRYDTFIESMRFGILLMTEILIPLETTKE